MKREIKFRGRNNGVWEYGNLIIADNGSPYIFPPEICETDGHHLRQGDDAPHWVDPATVGQYTGLKDLNGREIYEGDIFIESECLPGDNIPRKVFWEGGAFRCAYIKKHWATGYNNVPFQFLYELKKGNIEVIGNIHDNHELLEDKE